MPVAATRRFGGGFGGEVGGEGVVDESDDPAHEVDAALDPAVLGDIFEGAPHEPADVEREAVGGVGRAEVGEVGVKVRAEGAQVGGEGLGDEVFEQAARQWGHRRARLSWSAGPSGRGEVGCKRRRAVPGLCVAEGPTMAHSPQVPVHPPVLAWARRRAGLQVQDLVRAFPRYQAWEAGTEQPTLVGGDGHAAWVRDFDA